MHLLSIMMLWIIIQIKGIIIDKNIFQMEFSLNKKILMLYNLKFCLSKSLADGMILKLYLVLIFF